MRLSGSDLAVSAAVLFGAAGLLYLFSVDVNSSVAQRDRPPLGTVVFKKRSATRKDASRLSWERMRNNGPAYQADTLRTAGLSEAAVYFDDGTSLDMEENSMLKLDFGSEARSLEFLSGEISVSSSSKSGNYTVSSAAGKIDLDRGSRAVFSREEDTLSVEVSQGQAHLVRTDGSRQAIGKNQELAVSLSTGDCHIISRPIVPLLPGRNARLLSLGEDAAELKFAWESEADQAGVSAGDGALYTLEIASSKGFERPVVSVRTRKNEVRVPIGAMLGGETRPSSDGAWYWRVRGEAGKGSPPRKFTLTRSRPPTPALPADDKEYSFRNRYPEIRFAWTVMEEACAYLFEVSSDPTFTTSNIKLRTSVPSLAVATLGEGVWYWRVSAIHAFEVVGEEPAAPVRRFTIQRRPAMEAPLVSATTADSFYLVQDLDGKGLAFSWIPEAEAVSYEIAISTSQDLSSPILELKATEPYFRLSGFEALPIKKPGQYYWGVRWLDSEGSRSPTSTVRGLCGIDGSIAIRLSYPPDGYRIADSLMTNTRFTWKSNVPARTVFQVSRAPDFGDLVYQEDVTVETLLGRSWPRGTYYWRLRTYNGDGSVLLETHPRSFRVVDPFDGPSLLTPVQGSRFYLRENDRQEFVWDTVEGPEYFTVKLYSQADNYQTPLFEKGFVEGNRFVFQLGDLPSGTYKMSIQGFASANDASTRVIGYIGDTYFTYKRLAYIRLATPQNGVSIPGLRIRRTGEPFIYYSEDIPDSARVLISTDPGGRKVVLKKDERSGTIWIKKLPPGRYYWTVTGELAGFDISAREVNVFSVMQIPPLPQVELLFPSPGFIFGPEELRSRKSIVLEWAPVLGATHYSLVVYLKGSSDPAILVDMLPAPKYEIQDLSVLDRDEFVWGVRALAYDSEGELEQDGLESRSTFSIELPEIKKAQKKDAYYYGL